MLSSDAENFYWLSRYVERAENTAKLVNVNIELLLDFMGNKSEGWKPVIEITGMNDFFKKKYKNFNEVNSVKFLSQDIDNSNSILSCLEKAQYNARPIRDNLPRSSIHQLNTLLKNFNDQIKSTTSRRKRTLIISEVTSGTQLFFGIISDNFSVGTEYQFIKLGRFIERADMVSRIIDSQILRKNQDGFDSEFYNIEWTSILRSLSAYESFMISKGNISKAEIVEFLIKSNEFPRSILNCIKNVNDSLKNLPKNKKIKDEVDILIRKLLKSRIHNKEDVKIHKFIDNIQLKLNKINNIVSNTYFN
tara:strand:- start:1941 stop:2855 length:915 start_codon:yes stop_codon:yes gene_type:complete